MIDRVIRISMLGSGMVMFFAVLTLALTAADLHGRADSLYLFTDGMVQSGTIGE